MTTTRRHIRKILQHFRHLPRRYWYVAAIFVALFGTVVVSESNRTNLNYTSLLDTIAQGESKGNYNAYFGNATNRAINFSAMSVGDVLDWQARYIAEGNPSSAVGRYQFIDSTLRGLVDEMGISHGAIFDANLQDRLAVRLLERRGVKEYVRGQISREQFAHNLSKEWAALPRVIGGDPNASYYAHDGLNQARVKIDQIMTSIAQLKL